MCHCEEHFGRGWRNRKGFRSKCVFGEFLIIFPFFWRKIAVLSVFFDEKSPRPTDSSQDKNTQFSKVEWGEGNCRSFFHDVVYWRFSIKNPRKIISFTNGFWKKTSRDFPFKAFHSKEKLLGGFFRKNWILFIIKSITNNALSYYFTV